MCSGSKNKLNPSKVTMENGLQKHGDGFLGKHSLLLELSASDDLEGFRTAVEEGGLEVDEASFWYGRRMGSRKMGFEERTPLMIASMYGSEKVLNYVIDSGKADVNRSSASDGATALHCAAAGASSSSVEAVRLLLEASADPSSLNIHGNKPVDLVFPGPGIWNPRRKAVETLLGGSSPAAAVTAASASPPAERREFPVDVPLPDINTGVYGTDEFRMYSFKIKPCSRAYSHDWTECPFVHPGENARRRDPRKYPYSCVPCPEFRKGTCLKADSCDYAHGVFESWLHPAQYRTRLCKDETGCARKVCFFAHRTHELRPVYASTGSATDMAAPPMSPSPPMSPGSWQSKVGLSAPPALHLPGSRLKTALSARDFDLEMELFDEISRLSSPTLQMRQLRASYPAPSPPVRKQSPPSRAAAFKQRSLSFADRHMMMSSPPPPQPPQQQSNFSDWGSPDGKLDWAVQGDELSKLRKSASFGFRNGSVGSAQPMMGLDEPDVSWVHSLVKDVPAENQPYGLNLRYNQIHNKSVHEALPPWVEQLYIEQEQLVA